MKLSASVALAGLASDLAAATSFQWPAHAASHVARYTNTSSLCCNSLSKVPQLQGKVFGKNSTVYEARLDSYYSANAALEPWCMVLPTSTSDVSEVAKVISTQQCPFGMRSGAHSAFAGSNGVKDGITVDFGWLNGTTYDESTKIARIQPGSDWGMAFDALEPHGVATVGGRASVVGVGGFTTGGGYSFHSNSQGFACDSVVNFEVVLADGLVVNANPYENSDLYKSLKGGSGNFGFVTRVDQSVLESNKMWGGFVSYDLSERDSVFSAYLNFAENMDKDLYSQNIVALYYDSTGYSLRSILTNVEAKQSAPAFAEYMAINSTSNTLRSGSVAELVPEFTGPTPLGLYAEWMTGQTTSDFRVLDFIDKKHKEYTARMKAAAPDSDFNVLVQFQPVTESMVKHSHKNGGNVLGLEHVVAGGPTLMWLVAVTADTAENQAKIHPFSMAFRQEINTFATDIGANLNWEYLNYAYGDQDPIGLYGPESTQLLTSTAKKYDPKGVFQTLRRSGFKLPVY